MPEWKPPTIDEVRAVWEKRRVDPDIIRAAVARVAPSWRMMDKPAEDEDACHWFVRGTIQVLMSVLREDDGNIWIHVSLCGRRNGGSYYLPTFEDVKRVKNDFIGEDRWAYQVFPSQKDYVNQNPYVLHLYALFENRPALPDFTHGIGSI